MVDREERWSMQGATALVTGGSKGIGNVASIEFFQFKINHSKTKDMDPGNWISSPKLRVGQHDWVVKYFPRGCTKEHNGKYVSVLLELQRESVDRVTAEFGFELLDKHGNVSPTASKLVLHTFTSKSINWSFLKFFERTKLEQTYIKDDCFVLRVSINVGNAGNITSFTGFPYERLQQFREKNKRTDVTFNVDGKHFVAHRLIMAAHSPVFEAQLFGSMAESDMKCSIEIKEMMPSVFKAMLDFMYNGSLLIDEKFVDCEVPMLSTIFLQHLLVAADRYAIEKLSVACVFKLVKSISFDTVLSTLELAETHNSIVLKKACLRFIVENNDSVSLMSSEEYIKLMQNYPSLLTELKELAEKMRFSANYFKVNQYLTYCSMKYYGQ